MRKSPVILLAFIAAAVFLLFVIAAVLVVIQFQVPPTTPTPSQNLPPIAVYFSPTGGCTEAAVKEINAAKKMILVQAYSFTSAPIAKALVDAHNARRRRPRDSRQEPAD